MARKIHDDDLKRLLSEGLGVRQMAKELSCSPGAISKRLKGLNCVVRRPGLSLYRPGGDVRALDMVSQFMLINKQANVLLGKLVKASENVENLPNQKSLQDPRSLLIKLMGEIKSQIDLWHELEKNRFNVLVVREFMNELVTFLAEEVGEDAKKRFIDRINERESLRGILASPEFPVSGIKGQGEYS